MAAPTRLAWVNAARRDVECELADGDAHAVRAEVAKTEDAGAIRDDLRGRCGGGRLGGGGMERYGTCFCCVGCHCCYLSSRCHAL